MADAFGPDAEIASRRQAFLDAKRRHDAARAEAARLQIPLRTADVPAQVRERVLSDEADAYSRAVLAQQHLERGVSQHPANQYAAILEETDRIRAPALSGWDWFRQNPSLLEAVPKTDDERKRHAQADFLLRRIQEAVASNAGGPFAWDGYEGDAQIRSAADDARSYAADSRAQQSMANPYHYQPYTLTDDSGKMLPLIEKLGYPRPYGESATGSPLVDRVLWNALRPLRAIWSGPGRFHDNFAAGGAAVSEGRPGDAARSFGYALPNLISPAFHRGGPGMEDDWRQYVRPGEAAALDTAAAIPFYFTRGLYPSRGVRGLPATGAEERIRGLQGDMLRQWQAQHADLLRRAARRHHPDVGGSTESMKRVNEAFSAGDAEALMNLAR